MELKATKILQSAMRAGFVPMSFICAGELDKQSKAAKTGMVLNKTPDAQHLRMLACHFDPPEKYQGGNPVQKALEEFRIPNSKTVRTQVIKIGNLEAHHTEIQTRSPDGIALAVHAIALMTLGMVHRYSLSILQEKSDEGFESLKKLIAEACGD
jgi:hypothetical protein